MPKRARFFHPFDVTYSEVSRQARHLLETLGSQDEQRWLRDIMWNFQIEADHWDGDPDLEAFRELVSNQPLRILKLATSAYLHIAYDLPRVLADHWPDVTPYDPPGLARGHQLYDAIGRFFSEVIDDVRIMPEVVGASRPALSWQASRRVMRLWVVDLRRGAWMHAQMLRAMPAGQRRQVEQAMLKSIMEALSGVRAVAPWSMLDLLPPDDAFDGRGPIIYLAAGPILPPEFISSDLLVPLQITSIIISLTILGLLSSQALKSRKTTKDSSKSRFFKRKRKLSHEEADEIVSLYIAEVGRSIQLGLNDVFQDFREE